MVRNASGSEKKSPTDLGSVTSRQRSLSVQDRTPAMALPGEWVPLRTEPHHLLAVRAEEDESSPNPERSAKPSGVDFWDLCIAM